MSNTLSPVTDIPTSNNTLFQSNDHFSIPKSNNKLEDQNNKLPFTTTIILVAAVLIVLFFILIVGYLCYRVKHKKKNERMMLIFNVAKNDGPVVSNDSARDAGKKEEITGSHDREHNSRSRIVDRYSNLEGNVDGRHHF
ncbi:951_t:CDS:1 [Acaulospora morrowiae]|uniref:951_t:CDS:1 n=1 Tax=Acaulospora morrowiae TaxID=94023 RepID=A0A9N9IE24_9GLOM|nr:951_t:CDS:1 [Acaulospora morrowiae]